MEKCPNCEKLVEKLIPFDDVDSSLQSFQLIGVPVSHSFYLCISCAREYLGISDEELVREERTLSKNPNFIINLLKGRIGQVVIEAIFRNFGYEVYPYGYESYLTNIIKNLKKNFSNNTVKLIRSSPDSLIYDREINEGFLLEIKSTTQNVENFWIESSNLRNYIDLWGSAVLMIIHFPSLKVYCKPFDNINLVGKKENEFNAIRSKKGYYFNLIKEFDELSMIFRLIDNNELKNFTERIKTEIFKKYSC